ncbi:TfoX/Sxy family protein [Zobellia uliginosa]|mgnify:CR=1 FL=1|uniref:TfoX/Sxy family protein n=1 Tax=Zobellia uliginosa TaxID=143224 RepID=UPI001C06B686|nr:TfoX/Sxy family protein [Zobellia uliginosa]MBU2945941.1 TfoX/Sxy family protein [Zobellia uliginosa]
MAYDEYLADRSRQILKQKHIFFEEKKMMGSLCFMVDEKMCFAINIDKDNEQSRMMARVGMDNYEKALEQPYCGPMDLTGRKMKSYVYVYADGMDTDEELEGWIQLCLDFNPLAKKSKKKNKK